MLQFSSSQFSNLRWRYFVESLLLKSTPNVSSVALSSANERKLSAYNIPRRRVNLTAVFARGVVGASTRVTRANL